MEKPHQLEGDSLREIAHALETAAAILRKLADFSDGVKKDIATIFSVAGIGFSETPAVEEASSEISLSSEARKAVEWAKQHYNSGLRYLIACYLAERLGNDVLRETLMNDIKKRYPHLKLTSIAATAYDVKKDIDEDSSAPYMITISCNRRRARSMSSIHPQARSIFRMDPRR